MGGCRVSYDFNKDMVRLNPQRSIDHYQSRGRSRGSTKKIEPSASYSSAFGLPECLESLIRQPQLPVSATVSTTVSTPLPLPVESTVKTTVMSDQELEDLFNEFNPSAEVVDIVEINVAPTDFRHYTDTLEIASTRTPPPAMFNTSAPVEEVTIPMINVPSPANEVSVETVQQVKGEEDVLTTTTVIQISDSEHDDTDLVEEIGDKSESAQSEPEEECSDKGDEVQTAVAALNKVLAAYPDKKVGVDDGAGDQGQTVLNVSIDNVSLEMLTTAYNTVLSGQASNQKLMKKILKLLRRRRTIVFRRGRRSRRSNGHSAARARPLNSAWVDVVN